MSGTPDRFPGPKFTEEVIFEERGTGNDPLVIGGMRLVDSKVVVRDDLGIFDVRTGGTPTRVIKDLVSVKKPGCPELVFTKCGAVLFLRNSC